ncbi:MAG: hypothetical protein KF800_10155 [Lysobacter sp.]|nr:hypothetical protein [Lysobacter sp.]
MTLRPASWRTRGSWACLLIALLVAGNASAHQDTVIFRLPGGYLHGIPWKYGPAFLSLDRADERNGVAGYAHVALRLAAGKTALPACVLKQITPRKTHDVWVTASWYHEPFQRGAKVLPPYINIQFNAAAPTAAESMPDGESLLFNLETGRLLEMNQRRRVSANEWRMPTIDLRSVCSATELKNLLDPDYRAGGGGTMVELGPVKP